MYLKNSHIFQLQNKHNASRFHFEICMQNYIFFLVWQNLFLQSANKWPFLRKHLHSFLPRRKENSKLFLFRRKHFTKSFRFRRKSYKSTILPPLASQSIPNSELLLNTPPLPTSCRTSLWRGSHVWSAVRRCFPSVCR